MRESCAVNDQTVKTDKTVKTVKFFFFYCVICIPMNYDNAINVKISSDCLVINCTQFPHIRSKCFIL